LASSANRIMGRPVFFDIREMALTIEIAFPEEETIENIQRIIMEEEFQIITLKPTQMKNLRTSQQLKFWFVIVHKVLEHFKVPVTAERVLHLHSQMKRQFLPCDILDLGGITQVPIPPSLVNIEREVLRAGIERAIDTYRLIGIDFSRF
jgi:hypothetical protein